VAIPPGLVIPLALLSVLGDEARTRREIVETRHLRVTDKDNVSSFASIPSVGTTPGLESLPPKTDAAIPPITSADIGLGTIDESHKVIV